MPVHRGIALDRHLSRCPAVKEPTKIKAADPTIFAKPQMRSFMASSLRQRIGAWRPYEKADPSILADIISVSLVRRDRKSIVNVKISLQGDLRKVGFRTDGGVERKAGMAVAALDVLIQAPPVAPHNVGRSCPTGPRFAASRGIARRVPCPYGQMWSAAHLDMTCARKPRSRR